MTKPIVDVLEEAAQLIERFDGMPCCVHQGYTKRQKEIFNEGQQHATSFVADKIRRMKERFK